MILHLVTTTLVAAPTSIVLAFGGVALRSSAWRDVACHVCPRSTIGSSLRNFGLNVFLALQLSLAVFRGLLDFGDVWLQICPLGVLV
jgi:hypothetical protein